jgi:hypothetical protein
MTRSGLLETDVGPAREAMLRLRARPTAPYSEN